MPFVSGLDTEMGDAPNGSSTDAAALTINPFVIPLRVNGHADVTFTSPYDPSRSGQVSPVEGRTPWTAEGFTSDKALTKGPNTDLKGKDKTKYNPLPVSSLRTGLCYDPRMMYHAQLFEEEHPEQPSRIFSIYKALVDAGLVEDQNISGVSKEGGIMMRIDAREVTPEEAILAHSKEHWEYLASTAGT